MLKTGYFQRSSKEPGAVSIARFPPEWYTGAHCHRGRVAGWFLKTRGITVPALGIDTTTQFTF